jgi:hypothetical protein
MLRLMQMNVSADEEYENIKEQRAAIDYAIPPVLLSEVHNQQNG